MLTRRPAPRPWDVIALELLLTIACAIQVGLLLWLAIATWDDRGAPGAVIGVLVVVALAVGAGWFLWLTGVSGWLLTGASGVAGLEIAFLLVLGAAGEVVGVSASALLLSLGAAILGVLCGIFLPAPSSRRYRPAPRVRPAAGGPPSAPRVSPGVAAAADRYAKPVAAGAAALTAAGARKVSRSGGQATADDAGPTTTAGEGPVLQPRPGTPIRTSGPTDPDASPVTPATGTSTVSGATKSAPSSGTPATGTPAAGTATKGASGGPTASGASSTTSRSSTRTTVGTPDPGAIARQARASIDAELAKPRGTVRPTPATPATTTTPGFRGVDPPPPMTSVKSAPGDDLRFTASGRTAPPKPPGGQPVGRVGDVQQPGDPGAVDPVLRSVPPPPVPPATDLANGASDDTGAPR